MHRFAIYLIGLILINCIEKKQVAAKNPMTAPVSGVRANPETHILLKIE